MKKYDNLDGLRAFAAIGIICMHILESIGIAPQVDSRAGDYLINHFITQFGTFVQLFFVISGFGMCCGYYEKIKGQTISLNEFYNKRYLKILPFFTLLVLMDLAVSLLLDGTLSAAKLYEAFADLTLMFGFYTVEGMSVIGVGWTLGVIFGFYILFPFFVYLIWTKKRAWAALAVAIGITYVSKVYFSLGSSLTFNWLCFFLAGGLIFLYREEMERLVRNRGVGLLLTAVGFVLVYMIKIPWDGELAVLLGILKGLLGFSMMVVGALSPNTIIWSNPITKYISGVSLEIYLAHMMVFRVIEKANLTTIAGTSIASYVLTCAMTVAGVLLFAGGYKWVEARAKYLVKHPN